MPCSRSAQGVLLRGALLLGALGAVQPAVPSAWAWQAPVGRGGAGQGEGARRGAWGWSCARATAGDRTLAPRLQAAVRSGNGAAQCLATAVGQISMPQVIGHRGAKSVAPENTLASVRAAKALGCSWVEVDVMLSKDKVAVIHHDNTLDRCTNGEGHLWDLTVNELEALDAGAHFSAEFAGEKIPRLTALLRCCRDLELGLNLEVKHVSLNPEAPTADEEAMEQELAHVVCDVIESCGEQPRELVLSSFSRCAIAVLRRRLPRIPCAFLVWDIPEDWEHFMSKHQCASLNFAWQGSEAAGDLIRECAQKVPCYSYTVNDAQDARLLLSWGVRGVFSDCPHIVSAALLPQEARPAVVAEAEPDGERAGAGEEGRGASGLGSKASALGRKTLGVDHGRRRTGVCVSVGYAPRPLPLICHEDDSKEVAAQVGRLALKEAAEQIVVGFPLNSTGGEGQQAAYTRAFVSHLQDACPQCDILLWDERFSTAVAREKLQEVSSSLA
jgi:glycerophosphoryl diester phosphodiesterase